MVGTLREWANRVGRLFVVLMLCLVPVCALLLCWMKSGKPKAQQKECYAYLRVFSEALEAYNAQAAASGTSGIDRLASETQGLLISAGFLHRPLACPGGPLPALTFKEKALECYSFFTGTEMRPSAPGEYLGERILASGVIRCTLHGESPP